MKESVIKLIEVIMNKQELINKVKEFLDTLDVEYLENDTEQIPPLTLDFFIPKSNVAIDVNDFLNHNNTYNANGAPPSKNFYLNKSQICRKKGIRLIYGWEHCIDESINCKFGSWEVFQNIVKSACNKYDRQVYARKTKVVTFPAKDTKPFFDRNNINGHRGATTTYALVDKSIENPTVDDILMAYAVGHAYFGGSRFNDNYRLEKLKEYSLMVDVVCDNCKTTFQKRPSRVTPTNFCSNSCQGQYATEHRKSDLPTPPVEKKCSFCENTLHFHVWEYNKKIKRSPDCHFFCNPTCMGQFTRKRIETSCATCSTAIEKRHSEIKENNYCSSECQLLGNASIITERTIKEYKEFFIKFKEIFPLQRKPVPLDLVKYLKISDSVAYGVANMYRDKFKWQESYFELKVCDCLDRNKIKYERNVRSWSNGKYEIDIYIPSFNIAIEINDYATHTKDWISTELNSYGLPMKDGVYHSEKIKAIAEAAMIPIMLWEDEIDEFISTVDEIHAPKYGAEIARGACQLGLQVIGGASKLWKYIIENTDYDSIIYYVDINYFDGRSINFLVNTEYISEGVSFWNYHLDELALKNREPSKHSAIMLKKRNGLLYEVCNAGTQVNLWTRTKTNE